MIINGKIRKHERNKKEKVPRQTVGFDINQAAL